MPPDTLYYDGQCPLCSAEMQNLERLADGQLQLVNIHSLADDSTLPERETLLASLHLQRSNGDLLTGLDANVAAWQHTRFGPFVRWLRWPVIKPVADFVYHRWARLRYRRLYPAKAK